MIQSYRKKPVVIQAVQWTGRNVREVGAFLGDGLHQWQPDAALAISTLEGVMLALPGDFIIRGVNGEHYPCKPDIFGKTYEAVT